MRKTLSLFFLLLSLSCGKINSGASIATGDNASAGDEQAFLSEPTPDFEVNPVMIGFTAEQEEKVHRAARLIRKVFGSEEFKVKVLNYTYNGTKAFADNKGLSNAQIYRKILLGSEKLSSHGANRTMDVELELYTDYESTTIGYTYPNVLRIWMNRKYFNKFTPPQVADNMTHEWLHKLGFDHAVEATPERRHSVPYAIGSIVKALAQSGGP